MSVIIPTRSRATLLSRALASALDQEDVEVEAIVIDDGSRDETPRRLAELADPRLRVLRNEASCGVSASRNRGIAEARGKWIAFLDDDDFWAPTKLRIQLQVPASFICSSYVVVDEQGKVVRVDPAPGPAELESGFLAWRNTVGTPSTVVVETELLRRVGGFDERLRGFEDWDMWIRLAAAGRPGASPEVLAAYALHRRRLSTADLETVRDNLAYLLSKHGTAEYDEEWFQRWLASGQDEAGRRLLAFRLLLGLGLRRRSAVDLKAALRTLAGERLAGLIRPWPDQPERRPPWLDHFGWPCEPAWSRIGQTSRPGNFLR